MSAIISLVEGYGLFFSGISLLLLPFWGISEINLVAACYCGAALALLLGEMYRSRGVGEGAKLVVEGRKSGGQLGKAGG